MNTGISRRGFLGGAAALSAVALGACGSQEPQTTAEGLTKVVLMIVPTTAQAPAYLGLKKGIFKDAGLEVEIRTAADGNAITAAVTSGEATFGAGGLAAQILAIGKGVPVKVVAAQSGEDRPAALSDPVADGMIYVQGDSPIGKPADLAGKSIAVNGLVSNSSMVLKAALELQGVDPQSIKMVQVNFPEQVAALQQGQVDAIISAEPFSSGAKKAGLKPLMNTFPYGDSGPESHIISSWFTSAQTAGSSPQVITKFREALAKAQQYATEHDDELRTEITGYTKITPEQVKTMVLPSYPTSTDRAVVTAEIDLVHRYLEMPKKPTVDAVLAG